MVGMMQLLAMRGGGEPEAPGIWDERIPIVQAVLDKLPPRYRRILVLKFVEGWSHAEIAEDMGITERSAREYAYRAKNQFKKIYNELMRDRFD